MSETSTNETTQVTKLERRTGADFERSILQFLAQTPTAPQETKAVIKACRLYNQKRAMKQLNKLLQEGLVYTDNAETGPWQISVRGTNGITASGGAL